MEFKRYIAEAFHSLLRTRRLDHITVTDIMVKAGGNRKTFYYYFHDIYDLLEWMIRQSSERMIADFEKASTTEERIRIIFDGMEANREVILNAYNSVERGYLEREINGILAPLVESSIRDSKSFDGAAAEDKQLVADIISHGLTGILLQWFGENMKPVPKSYQKTICEALEGGLLRHFAGDA